MSFLKLLLIATSLLSSSLLFSQAPEKTFTEKLDGIQTSSTELTKNASTDNSSVGQSGAMSTAVPLINISSRTMSFPLQLNYASGIKVDQNSGSVGLGWVMPIGSIVRDYGAFEPDYTSLQGELTMNNSAGNTQIDGWLNPNGNAINPSTHNEVLGYNTIPENGQPMTLSDEYHVNVPGFLGNTFWNGATVNQNHDWKWSTHENWLIQGVAETFVVSQEFSRVNELNIATEINGQFNTTGSYANAIGVLPYVINGEAHLPSSNLPSVLESEVVYDDFGSFIITDDKGVQYVFGRTLRGQKFVFSDNPYWSSRQGSGSNAANGNFWKIDYIAEWLLTEIRSVDYQDINNNGFADDGDAGDWIRFEYTEKTKIAETVPYGSTNLPLKSEVPMHREWSSYSQTDQASSLMRERAYLTKIITPTQKVDFTVSTRLDVEHDYFNKPANKRGGDFYYEDLMYISSGSTEDFDIKFPVETMKYDTIKVYSKLMDKSLYPNENLLTGSIVLNYAQKGSAEELAVSEFLIRKNDDTPKLDVNGSILGKPSTANFDVNDCYSNTEKRGKTTLLSIDFLGGDSNPLEKNSFEFEYAYNPSFSEIHKREIFRKWAFPSLRQATGSNQENIKATALLDYSEITINSQGQPNTSSTNHYDIHPNEFLIDFPYQEKWYKYDNPSVAEMEAYVEQQTSPNLGIINESISHPLKPIKDQFGYFYAELCNTCSQAWTLTKITYPTGGEVSFEYEQAPFDNVTDPLLWSFNETEIPLIEDYNELAKQRSTSQDTYNKYATNINAYDGFGPEKQLTATFEVDLPSYYGIRLLKKTINDRVNPVVTIDYEYGNGHFTSLPAEFIANYISGFNQFLVRENQRHYWEYDYYPTNMTIGSPYFKRDFTEKMSYAANSNIALDDYQATFYYEYIDNKMSDLSYTRRHFSTPQATISSAIPIYDVYCIKFPSLGKDGRYILGGNQAIKEPILPIKKEYFQANETLPYKSESSSYTYLVIDSRETIFDYGTSNNTLELYSQSFENWLPMSASFWSPNNYVVQEGIELGPFVAPVTIFNWSTISTGTPNGDAFAYNKDHLIPYTSSITTNPGFYQKWTTTKLLLNEVVTNYKGMVSTKSYLYDPTATTYNLWQETSTATYTSEIYITTYEYAQETYNGLTTVFDDLNLKKVPTRVNTYLDAVNPANTLSASMTTFDYTNFSAPRPLKSYQYETNIDPITGVFTLADFVIGGQNANWRISEADLLEYNDIGQLISSRTNRLFNKTIYGNNFSVSKAQFNYPENNFDATYTGFEDLYRRHDILDWNTESYKAEDWFVDEIELLNEPAYSMHSDKNICGITVPVGANLPFAKELNVITVDNITNLNIGDNVTVDLFGTVSALPNGINYAWTIETTITDIKLRVDNPTGSGSGPFNYILDYVLCFSDPIEFPSSSTILTGVIYDGYTDPIDERAYTTISQTIVTKNNPEYHLSDTYSRTGNYSYQLETKREVGTPSKKTAIRPVKIEYIPSSPSCFDPQNPENGYESKYDPNLNNDCFWNYEASLWLKYDFDAPSRPISEPVPNQTLDASADAIYRRGIVTETDNGSGFKIICDVWTYDRTQLIEQKIFYVENISTAWQQFTVNIPIKKGSVKYLDVYVQNDIEQIGHINPSAYKSLFVDDVCIYPEGSKYGYTTVDKFGNATFVTDNNDVFVESIFDEKGRQTHQKNAYGSVVAETAYFDTPNWVNEINHVTSRQWIDNGVFNESRYYLDGFGKTKQVIVSDVDRSARIVSETNIYDSKGFITKAYKPYALNNATLGNNFNAQFDIKTQNLYGSYYAFTQVTYEAIPEQKLSTVMPPRTNSESVISASQSDYASLVSITHPYMATNGIFPAGELLIHETIDAKGNKVWTYMDNLGRVILEEHEIGADYVQNPDGSILDIGTGNMASKTWFKYDGAGRIIEVIDPSGKVTSYEYNSLGVVIKKTSPDKGTSELRYDKYGQVRFVRNAKDIAAVNSNLYGTDQFKYMKYDEWGRVIESGMMMATNFDPATIPFTPALYFDDYTYINDQNFPQKYSNPMTQVFEEMAYDDSRYKLNSDAILRNTVHGDHNMNTDATWEAGKTDVTKYFYMADGQIAKVDYLYQGLTNAHSFKPQYNGLRMPTGKKYIHPTNSQFNFEWKTLVDNFGRVQTTSTSHNSTSTEHGNYYYDVLGNLLMKGIGSTGVSTDPHIDYQTYENDIRDQLVHFVSKNFRYGIQHDDNGNITSQYWSTSYFDDNAMTTINQYEYTYDKMNRLIGADYKDASMPSTTFDYYTSISTDFPNDFYCGVNQAAFMDILDPIYDELNSNIKNKIKVALSKSSLTAMNVLKVDYINNNVAYQTMSEADKDVFLTNYITNIQNARSDVFAYEQYEAEKYSDQDHLNIISSQDPAPQHMKYTKLLLNSIIFVPDAVECDPNPNATVFSYLPSFPYPTTMNNTTKYDAAYWYSENGNITDLNRNDELGVKTEQDYTYAINTNNYLTDVEWTVANVPNASHSYNYDISGNLVDDSRNNVTNIDYISYNDMPKSITNNTGTTNYRYNASGTRIVKEISASDFEYYFEGVVVKQNGDVKSYQTAEGYAEPFGTTVTYYYNVRDWLGTNRGVMNSSGATLYANDHYPFGMRMPDRVFVSTGDGNRYQFTGHEYDSETNYGYHGARYYNRELGKYMSVDPLAEQFFGWSSYNYVMGNPIMLIDPTGKGPTDWVKNIETLEYVWDNTVTNQLQVREGFEYIGKEDSDVIKDLYGSTHFTTTEIDYGTTGFESGTTYSSASSASIETILSAQLTLIVEEDADGHSGSRKLKGVNVFFSTIVNLYGSNASVNTNYSLYSADASVNGESVSKYSSEKDHHTMRAVGNLSNGTVRYEKQLNIPLQNINISLEGQYATETSIFMAPSWAGLFSTNSLNVVLKIPLIK